MAKLLAWGARTYVMGVLNLTPDSFSGDGLLSTRNPIRAGRQQAKQFVEDGADILDLGAESSRPGAISISVEEELERLLPILDALREEHRDVIMSVDTNKSEVAEEVLEHGADWINDIWGLKRNPLLAQVAAKYHAPMILMHNRQEFGKVEKSEQLGGHYVDTHYQDVVEEVKAELLESVQLALKAGIPQEHIILDPGIGFGKNVEQNLELMRRLDEIKTLGYPLLIGPSRKSFIGYTLNLPPDQRVEGTAAAVAISITRGVDIVRVHDVKEMVRVARMADAIVRAK